MVTMTKVVLKTIKTKIVIVRILITIMSYDYDKTTKSRLEKRKRDTNINLSKLSTFQRGKMFVNLALLSINI